MSWTPLFFKALPQSTGAILLARVARQTARFSSVEVI
jgi:hypothetical protein